MSGITNNNNPPSANTNRDATELTQQKSARAIAFYQNNLELADPLQLQINRPRQLTSSSARAALQYARTTQLSLTLQQQLATLDPAQFRITTNLSVYPLPGPQFRDVLPTDITSLRVWFDAADTKSLTFSGTTFLEWIDKSGYGYNATVSSNAYATYSNSSLYFNNSYYTTTYPANPFNETLFIVFAKPVLANNVTNTVIGSQTGGREIGIGSVTTSQFAVMNAGIATASITDVGTVVANTMTFGVSQITNGNTQVQLNGGAFAPSVPLSFSAGKTTDLGRENGTSFGYVGFVYEILIFNVSLSTAQRQLMEGYLAWKWGLQGRLPANHPYKSAKPAPVPV